jgi:hypothetical protein
LNAKALLERSRRAAMRTRNDLGIIVSAEFRALGAYIEPLSFGTNVHVLFMLINVPHRYRMKA